jgi:hypothetical protein
MRRAKILPSATVARRSEEFMGAKNRQTTKSGAIIRRFKALAAVHPLFTRRHLNIAVLPS